MKRFVTPFLLVFMLFAVNITAFADAEGEPIVEPEPVTYTEDMLILNSAIGVPDTLRVIFYINGCDVAVVKGSQIINADSFPEAEKASLKIRLEGEGRLIGAKFDFQPFMAEPILPPIVEPVPPVVPEEPELPELPEEPIEEQPIEEPIDEQPLEEEITEPETPAEEEPTEDEDITEGDITEPEENAVVDGDTEGEPAEVDVTEGETDAVEDDADVAEGDTATEGEDSDVGDTNSDVVEGDSGDADITESAEGDVTDDSGDTAGDTDTTNDTENGSTVEE